MKVIASGDNTNEIVVSQDLGQIKSKSTEIQDLLKAHETRNKENSPSALPPLRFPGISEILPTLYLCGAGVAIPSVLDQLKIKFIVNAAPELPDTPLSDSKPLYLRVNVLDKGDVDLKSFFNEVVDMIEEVRQSNGKTLVHCVAGVSRSASLCIAYLVKHMGMTLREAYHHVKSTRPQIRPNIGFFRQLMAYEEELRGCRTVEMIFCEALGQEIPDVYEPEYRAMEEFYQKHRKNFKKR